MFDIPLEKPRGVRQVAEMVYGAPIRYKQLAGDVCMPEQLVRMSIFGPQVVASPTICIGQAALM